MEFVVNEDQDKISEGYVVEMIAFAFDCCLVENKTLVVHLQEIALEVCEIYFLKGWSGKIRE